MLDYIIVQAGGKGTRLEYLTSNKPKCLVPIQNLPMLFHLFKKYPDKKYIIIGDYKYDVLKKYLEVFADVQYLLVDARGENGTCAGIGKAISMLPEKKDFLLIWSDLVLPEAFHLPEKKGNYIGISKDFPCRWLYKNRQFAEEASTEYGVAGFFIFSDKTIIGDVPDNGEFVRYLQGKEMVFDEVALYQTKEYGLISEYNKIQKQKCRPFNRMTVKGSHIIKEGVDEQGKKLAIREKSWYQHVTKLGFQEIPKIYSYTPFEMEKIAGKNVYEYQDASFEKKKIILTNIIECLRKLHSLQEVETDFFSMKEAYLTKTRDRLSKVRDLIPFAQDKFIQVNGKKCKNVFFYWNELEDLINQIDAEQFVLLHGDCTFSNILIREDYSSVLIDPRGYFGYTELYGDVKYDWSKLYYSVVGNYDNFNLKKFRLNIKETEVQVIIDPNGWEEMEEEFFRLIPDVNSYEIKLIHAIIWLSLTTYAWEDYDSICGAFYQGLYYLADLW